MPFGYGRVQPVTATWVQKKLSVVPRNQWPASLTAPSSAMPEGWGFYLRAQRYIGAGGTLIEHGRRVEHGPGVCDLVIHREGALGVALHEAQVPFDDVAVDRQIPVRKTVEAEHRGGAAVEALPPRIPVVPNAEIERERTESRAEPAVDIDLGRRAVRERDALARNADIVLQILGHIVARL